MEERRLASRFTSPANRSKKERRRCWKEKNDDLDRAKESAGGEEKSENVTNRAYLGWVCGGNNGIKAGTGDVCCKRERSLGSKKLSTRKKSVTRQKKKEKKTCVKKKGRVSPYPFSRSL